MLVSTFNTAHFHVWVYSFIQIYGKPNNAEDTVTHRARGEFPHDRVRRPQHGKKML